MRKRLLSLLLCIVMSFSMLPGTVFAEAGGDDEGGSDAGYTVTFDANGGTGSMEKGQIDDSGFYTIPNTCAFTNEPYKFYGWNTEKDGSGSTYESGREEYFGEEDVTLYAQWILDFTDESTLKSNDDYVFEKNGENDNTVYTLKLLNNCTISSSFLFPVDYDGQKIDILVDGNCSINGKLLFQQETLQGSSNGSVDITITKNENSSSSSLVINGIKGTSAGDSLTINIDVTINSDLDLGASAGSESKLKINNSELKISGNLVLFQYLTMTETSKMEIGGNASFNESPTITLSEESIIVIAGNGWQCTLYKESTISTLDCLNDWLPQGYTFKIYNGGYYLYKIDSTGDSENCYTGQITLSKHKHIWTYECIKSDGSSTTDTIKAICTKCPRNGNEDYVGGTVQIVKPERDTYCEENTETSPSEEATLKFSESIENGVAFSDNDNFASNIKYYEKNNDGSWNELRKAPTDAGTYKASISVSTGTEDSSGHVTTAYVEYTIAKAEPIKPEGLSAAYGQTLEDVNFKEYENGTGWIWDSPKDLVGNVGEREHKASYAGDANHKSAQHVNLTVYVAKSGSSMKAESNKKEYTYGEDVKITVSDIKSTKDWPLDGDLDDGVNPLSLNFSELASNQVAIYDDGGKQLTEPQDWNGEPLIFTLSKLEVKDYKLQAKFFGNDNMEGTTADVSFKVVKAKITIAAENKSAYVGDDAPDLTTSVEGKDYTISGLLNGDTLEEGVTIKLNYKENEPDMSKAGTYDIVPSADGVDSRYTFKLVNGVLTVKSKSSSSNNSDGNYYLIKASAGENGSIEKSGNVSVRRGNDQKFTITPDDGYKVADVKVDGESVGALTSYVFKNVITSHTIEVTFEKISGFNDVPPGSYYEDPVNWAVDNGITNGTSGNTFSPDGVCTRAQAVTFLWRASGCPEPNSTYMPFIDVPENTYYYKAVLWGVENKIVKGTSPTTFSPDMHCSRAHIVTFLWRTMGEQDAGTVNPFTDVKETYYYADAVLWAVKEEITNGTSPTTFSPDDDCLRSQIVTFIYRALADQL